MDINFAQIMGFVSFALALLTFYQKDDRKLKILMLVFNINHVIHFFLMGSITSVISALLSTMRTATSIYYASSKYLASLFILLSLALGISFADNWWDLWPIIGSVIGTFAIFMLKGITMRITFLAGSICWLINNIIIGSIGGTLLEIMVITTNSLTVYKLIVAQKIAISNQKL